MFFLFVFIIFVEHFRSFKNVWIVTERIIIPYFDLEMQAAPSIPASSVPTVLAFSHSFNPNHVIIKLTHL